MSVLMTLNPKLVSQFVFFIEKTEQKRTLFEEPPYKLT